jgi:hypothetical protein
MLLLTKNRSVTSYRMLVFRVVFEFLQVCAAAAAAAVCFSSLRSVVQPQHSMHTHTAFTVHAERHGSVLPLLDSIMQLSRW